LLRAPHFCFRLGKTVPGSRVIGRTTGVRLRSWDSNSMARLKLLFSANPVPIINLPHHCERDMRFSERVIECDRRGPSFRKRITRRSLTPILKQVVTVSQPGVGESIVRVHINRLLKVIDALLQGLASYASPRRIVLSGKVRKLPARHRSGGAACFAHPRQGGLADLWQYRPRTAAAILGCRTCCARTADPKVATRHQSVRQHKVLPQYPGFADIIDELVTISCNASDLHKPLLKEEKRLVAVPHMVNHLIFFENRTVRFRKTTSQSFPRNAVANAAERGTLCVLKSAVKCI